MNRRTATATLSLLVLLGQSVIASGGERYDIAILNGRVMDPETGLDAVRHVGIRDGSIAHIGEERVSGATEIDATGLVVAPGFIDLNNHDVGPDYFRMKALDGVTSVLVLESGALNIDKWYEAHAGKALVHYGSGVDTGGARMVAADDPNVKFQNGQVVAYPTPELANRALTEEERTKVRELVDAGLARGAVAVSMGIEYLPGTTHSEVLEMFELAAEHGAFVFAHIRDWDETRDYDQLYEMIAASAITGAPAHVTHLNSMADEYVERFLRFIAAAQARGIDVTTDGYPYTAGLTGIEATFFDDWESWDDKAFGRYQWAATGEWLTRETFGEYRETGGWVLIHGMKEEWIRAVVAHPIAIVASDGAWDDGRGHPRGGGTFARVLGRYVREEKLLSLMDALRKMTLMPAERLATRVPGMRHKGRLQVGADADVTIFDPETVLDRATYLEPTLPSAGIRYVLVKGVPVVVDGEAAEGATPGEPIRGRVIEDEAANEAHVSVAPGRTDSGLVLDRATVIDLRTGELHEERSIWIDSDRIVRVAPSGEPAPAGVERVDLAGAYVIPGLWDMHAHWFDEASLPLFIANGVTGIRQMFGFPIHHEWRRRITSGELIGPRQVIASVVDGPEPVWPGSITAADAEEGRRAVSTAIEENADFIKVYSLLPREAFLAIAEEANRREIPFAGHVPEGSSLLEAAASGQRSVEHLSQVLWACTGDEERMDALAERGELPWWKVSPLIESYSPERARRTFEELAGRDLWMCPTLTWWRAEGHAQDEAIQNDPRLRYMPPAVRSRWAEPRRWTDDVAQYEAEMRANYAKSLEIVGAMHRAGVKLLAGTDVLNPYCMPGFSLHDELELLVEAGLTPLEALRTATIAPAEYLQREDEMGSVEAGTLADLVILSDNPLERIEHTTSIVGVVAAGRYYDPAEIAAMLNSARESATP